ncbi:MAG: phosphatase PAP2 family protein [Actinomycetota bacterium]|nr:phosphatase PAP2 family protein [Actinomycetota bacterium]
MPTNTPRLIASDKSRLAMVLIPVFAATLLSLALPGIALNTGFADVVVLITDTAAWPQLTIFSVAALIMLISRHGISNRRRRVEAGAVVLVMLVVLAGNGMLNEYVVKPFFGIPRPNIVTLTAAGDLGTDIPDADAFYASGDKEARRDLMREHLPTLETPQLSDRVRAHWIHETGYSFPSGHATAAMALASMLAAFGLAWLNGWRRLATTVVIPAWAVAVAYSRVLLEVHTASDIIAGTLAGFWWGLVAFGAIRWTIRRFAPAATADS